MQEAEAEPWMRPLQNQLPLVRHLTTAAGLWMPQYLRVKIQAVDHRACHPD